VTVAVVGCGTGTMTGSAAVCVARFGFPAVLCHSGSILLLVCSTTTGWPAV